MSTTLWLVTRAGSTVVWEAYGSVGPYRTRVSAGALVFHVMVAAAAVTAPAWRFEMVGGPPEVKVKSPEIVVPLVFEEITR